MTFDAPALIAIGTISGRYVTSATFQHNTDNDRTFDCNHNDQGVLKAVASVSGILYTGNLGDGLLEGVGSISGEMIPGTVFYGLLEADGSISADFFSTPPQRNWVAWSKIGEASFTIDRVNDAGRRQMPWSGDVYQVKQIGSKPGSVVVYGENGIAVMFPVSEPAPTFGLRQIAKTGIQSRYAVTGNKDVHYFIDSRGDLNQMEIEKYTSTPDIKNLGFREFLSTLGANLVMSFDEVNSRVYICDGTTGYVYNGFGLGRGPATLTSVAKQGTEIVYAAPAAVVQNPLSICTDILDFGVRTQKTLQKIEVSTYFTGNVLYAVDYRNNIKEAFKTSAWQLLNNRGEGFVWKAGVDFRVRLRSLSAVNLAIDSIKIFVNISDRSVQ